jgi:replicative DNA helicase
MPIQRLNIEQEIELGKIPPNDIETEKAIIGAILNDKDSIYRISSMLRPEMFYKQENQIIFENILILFKQSKGIDLLTLTDQLRKTKELETVGGPFYLTELQGFITSSSHIEIHTRIVKQKFIARELIRISNDTTQAAFDDSIDVDDTLDSLQSEIHRIVGDISLKDVEKISDVGIERLKELNEICQNDEKYSGVPSGFNKLDRLTSGWQDGDYIIIGARPSMGKSYLGILFAKFAVESKINIGIFSLEMSSKQIYDRLLSINTGIENGYFRTGKLNENDWVNIESSQRKMEGYELYVDDSPGLTIMQFKAKAKLLVDKFKVKLIIIDYLQLMKSDVKRSREEEVSQISDTIKATAKELNIPIIAFSQLNRGVENRGNKKPNLSDLRESGALEQGADVVIFIHRPEYYGIDEVDNESSKGLIELIIEKHRNGPLGELKIWHNSNWTQFSERLDIVEDIEGERTERQYVLSGKDLASGEDNIPF